MDEQPPLHTYIQSTIYVNAALASLLLLAFALPVAAQSVNLPSRVKARVAEIAKECRERGGKMRPGRKFIRTADFNRDGKPDYVLDFNHEGCHGTLPGYCGSGGCSLDVFLSSPKGYFDSKYPGLGYKPEIKKTANGYAISMMEKNSGAYVLRWSRGKWR